MRKLIAALGLLLGLAPNVWGHDMGSMPMPATFANSYAYTRTYTYDPTVGTAGTIYVTVAATGAMQPNPGIPCSTLHTAVFSLTKADGTALKNPDGTVMGNVRGTPTAACSNMAFSHTFAVDANLNGCNLIDLYSGTCQFESEMEISCPLMGLFAIKWMDIQFETAITWTYVSALTKANGWHPQSPFCSDRTTPPDWPGPFEANGPTKAGVYASATFVYREVPWGQEFTNVSWQKGFDWPFEDYVQPQPSDPPDCTDYDGGFKTGEQVFPPPGLILPGLP